MVEAIRNAAYLADDEGFDEAATRLRTIEAALASYLPPEAS